MAQVVPEITPPPVHFLIGFALISLTTLMTPENGGIPPIGGKFGALLKQGRMAAHGQAGP